MKNNSLGCTGFECPAANLFRTRAGLGQEYWYRRLLQHTSFCCLPVGENRAPKSTTERGNHFAVPVLPDNEDVEEFPLLLRSDDVSALIKAADQHGLCAASLARLVIHDYVLWIGGDVAGTIDGVQSRSAEGTGR